MPGEEAKLLGRSMVSRIVNLGIDREKENVISVGSLLRDDQIEVLLKVEDFIKVHFGIFGFTGVGKSNLLSTLIDRTLSSRETTKIVLLDVMDEYKGILFDQFLRKEVFSELIILDVESLPGPVFDYINGGYQKGIEELAVRSFLDTLLLPRSLKSKTLLDAMRERTPEVLKKIRIVVESRNSPKLHDIDQFRELLAEVREYFPQYAPLPLRPIFASLYVPEHVVKYCTRHSIYALGMGPETMQLLNLDELPLPGPV